VFADLMIDNNWTLETYNKKIEVAHLLRLGSPGRYLVDNSELRDKSYILKAFPDLMLSRSIAWGFASGNIYTPFTEFLVLGLRDPRLFIIVNSFF
jgi:hypothetical protein